VDNKEAITAKRNTVNGEVIYKIFAQVNTDETLRRIQGIQCSSNYASSLLFMRVLVILGPALSYQLDWQGLEGGMLNFQWFQSCLTNG